MKTNSKKTYKLGRPMPAAASSPALLKRRRGFDRLLFAAMPLLLLSVSACAAVMVNAPGALQDAGRQPFLSHRGDGPFGTTLALNVPYAPVKLAREQIGAALGIELDYFKSWDPRGEGHVTVITPVEYWQALRHYISIGEIEAIALENGIQNSDLEILCVGSGKALLDGKEEETFFFIVESANLRKIRERIYRKFLDNGGEPGTFSPDVFYPHITIGYTKRDLHLQDGIIKDREHSKDARFEIPPLKGLSD